MRTREKSCAQCLQASPVLYRCRYAERTEWLFLCEPCLTVIKAKHGESYQYGGTWKRNKR
jgi:hypothetical protein